MTLPCDDLVVVDFTPSFPGALATMILADYGATVIKVERPESEGTTFKPASLMWDRGKVRVTLDLKTSEGQQAAQRIARSADVVVEAFRPGVADRLGIGYSRLSEDNPGLIYCSITGFGHAGPFKHYKGYDALVAAKSGRMLEFNGQLDREGPVFSAVPVGSFGAVNAALQGILAALYVRSRSGIGQYVETSILHGMTPFDWGSQRFQMEQKAGAGSNAADPPNAWQTTWPVSYLAGCTKDGVWLQFANNMPRLYRSFVTAIGLDEIWDDPLFADAPGGVAPEDRSALHARTLSRLREKTWPEWKAIFDQFPDISVEPFITTQQAMDHPQMRHNGSVVEVKDPRVGPTEQIGPLVFMSETPAHIAPAADQPVQISEILGLLAESDEHGIGGPVFFGSAEALPDHPLTGVTVLEFAGWYAGPFGTSMVADLGARVIKIEPVEGDPFRPMNGTVKTSAGKEGVALNLQTPEGRRIAHELVKKADVVMQNYRPGVPERLGIDYDTLKGIKPDLVYLYAGLYGDSGPSMLRPGFHPTAGAVSGGALYQAGEALPPPDSSKLTLDELRDISWKLERANEGNPDSSAAVVVGTAILLGLLARERTSKGQYMLTTMINSNCYAMSDDFIRYAGKPPRPAVDGQGLGLGPLYRLYQAQTGWVFIAAPTDAEWRNLAQGLERPDLADDPRFATAEGRDENADALAAELDQALRTRGAEEWEAILTARDVGCVRVPDVGIGATLSTNPVMEETGIMVEVDDPVAGHYLRYGPNVQFSATPSVAGPSVILGQHTHSVLRELGYDENAITELKKAGVVGFPES